MSRPLLCILMFSWSFSINGQTIVSISKSICDSINKMPCEDQGKRYIAQLGVYAHELIKYPTLLVDITGMNRPHQFNEFSYRINRDLLQTCPEFQDQFTLMPLSKILDIEGLFNDNQYDSLENTLVSIINSKKMNVVVVTMDDFYPFQTIEDYTNSQGKRWGISDRYEKGGLLIVLSRHHQSVDVYIDQKSDESITQKESKRIFQRLNFLDTTNATLFQDIIKALHLLGEQL